MEMALHKRCPANRSYPKLPRLPHKMYLSQYCSETEREIRFSTGTHDRKQAERERKALQKRLNAGERPRPLSQQKAERLTWDQFREQYRRLKTFRTASARESANVRLDVCEELVKPKSLERMADTKVLTWLQAELASTRSLHTAASYMASLAAALNWAHKMGWLPNRVAFDRLKTSQIEMQKGRPISEPEFQLMLDACDTVCKNQNPSSWKHLLRGLWTSGLRLAEILAVNWDDLGHIRPLRHSNGCIVLQIPADLQKNGRDQTIPTIPAFAALLAEIPEDQRTGFVFCPGRERGEGRYTDVKRVGRIITAIGKAAGVSVNSEGKPASAHDLRRSFSQRLADAGVPLRELQSIMRHSRVETTERYYLKHNAAEQAKRLAERLNGYALADRTQVSAEAEST